MQMVGLRFELIKVNIEEILLESPEKTVMENARRKALKGWELVKEGIVAGFDTIVCIKGNILGKPHCREEAECMIRQLHGNLHTVYTGIYLKNAEKEYGEVISTKVRFREMTEDELSLIHISEPTRPY